MKTSNFSAKAFARARSTAVFTFVLTALLALTLRPAAADQITLTDGKVILGLVDQDASDQERLVLRTSFGVIHIPRAKIKQINSQAGQSKDEVSGDLAVSDNHPEQALELYKKALASEPNNATLKKKVESTEALARQRSRHAFGAMFGRIDAAIKAGDYATALSESDAMMGRVHDENTRGQLKILAAQAHIGMARKCFDSVDYPEAENHYNQAIQLDPENPLALLDFADMLQLSPSRKGQALPLYQKGIELARKHPGEVPEARLLESRYNVGQLSFEEKKYKEAAEAFLDVTREDKTLKFPKAVDKAMDAYAKMDVSKDQDMKATIASLQSIIQIKRPGYERAYQLLGRIYFDQHDWKNARQMLEMAVKLAPSGTMSAPIQESLFLLGLSNRQLGAREDAAQNFQTLIAQRASNYEAICELAEIRLEQGSYDEALSLFEQGVGVDKDKCRAYLGKGLTLMKRPQPDYTLARESFKEVLDRDSKNVDAQLAMARSYIDEKSFDDAVTESEKLIDLIKERVKNRKASAGEQAGVAESAPIVPAGDSTETSGSLSQDKQDKEEKELEKKYSDDDKKYLAEAWTFLGLAQTKTKATNQARENFQKAIKAVANCAPALEGMAESYKIDDQQKEAQTYYQKAIDADPGNPLYYLIYGKYWHENRKDPKQALVYYNKYLEKGGKDPAVQGWIKECQAAPEKQEEYSPLPIPAKREVQPTTGTQTTTATTTAQK